ncbi:MAG: hypothetical protein AAFR11_01340 [Pseudomonadota bacterium]
MSPSSNPGLRVRDILDAVDAIERYATDAGGVDALIGAPSVYRDGIERRLLIISEAATKLTGQVEALEPAIDCRARSAAWGTFFAMTTTASATKSFGAC